MSDLEQLTREALRRGAKRKILDDCHEGQDRFLWARDGTGALAKFVNLRSPRRFGKTEGFLRYAGHHCETIPGFRVLCCYQQAVDAKEIAWPLIEDLKEKYGWNCKLNSVEMAARWPAGRGVIKIVGLDRPKKHRRVKGSKWDLVLFDEGQDWYSDLERLVQWVMPGVGDRRGRIFMTGTPPEFPVGYFLEVQNGEHPQWVTVTGTAFENPATAVQHHEDIALLQRAGVDTDTEPWVRREYYGELAVDTRKQVVKLRPALNHLTEWKPHVDDQYILTIDWGDTIAFVVQCWNQEQHPWLIFLEGETHRELLVQAHPDKAITEPQILETIQRFQAKYPNLLIVADSSGTAKAIVQELRNVHGIPIINVDKADKRGEIELTNTDASIGLLKIFYRQGVTEVLEDGTEISPHPEKSPIAEQWMTHLWIVDPVTGEKEEGTPRHISDCCLYGRRYTAKHLYKEPVENPAPNTPEAWAEEAARMRKIKVSRMKRQNRSWAGER